MNRLRLIGIAATTVAASFLTIGAAFSTPGGEGKSFAAPTSAKPIKIAFVTNNASDYWLIAEAGANQAQKELGHGYQVDFGMPSESTVAVQEAMINNYIADGVRAIALSPVDAKKQTAWINKIAGKVSVITQDSDAPLSTRLAYLGTDNHAAGLLAGSYILKALPRGGKIEMFVGSRVAQNSRAREQGIRDALKGSSIEIVDVLDDHADASLAKKDAADAMTAHPDLSMEVGLYSYNGPAIIEAVEEARNVGKVKIVCFDQEKATLAGVKNGAVFATVVQQPYKFGYDGTKLLAQLALGNNSRLPRHQRLVFKAVAVTPSTLDKYVAELNKETGYSWGPGN